MASSCTFFWAVLSTLQYRAGTERLRETEIGAVEVRNDFGG